MGTRTSVRENGWARERLDASMGRNKSGAHKNGFSQDRMIILVKVHQDKTKGGELEQNIISEVELAIEMP